MDNFFSLLKIYATAKVSTLCCMEYNIAIWFQKAKKISTFDNQTNTCYRVQIPKVFNTINCTCTIPSISDISRLACAHVWSVCVITGSVNVAFLRSCFALICICRENQQISQRKEEKHNEKGKKKKEVWCKRLRFMWTKKRKTDPCKQRKQNGTQTGGQTSKWNNTIHFENGKYQIWKI